MMERNFIMGPTDNIVEIFFMVDLSLEYTKYKYNINKKNHNSEKKISEKKCKV